MEDMIEVHKIMQDVCYLYSLSPRILELVRGKQILNEQEDFFYIASYMELGPLIVEWPGMYPLTPLNQ